MKCARLTSYFSREEWPHPPHAKSIDPSSKESQTHGTCVNATRQMRPHDPPTLRSWMKEKGEEGMRAVISKANAESPTVDVITRLFSRKDPKDLFVPDFLRSAFALHARDLFGIRKHQSSKHAGQASKLASKQTREFTTTEGFAAFDLAK